MTVDEQLQILTHGCESIYSEKELRKKLDQSAKSGRPLRAKLGMDPTAPDIHIGHTVVLRKLEAFQRLGHTPIFLVGDFTARIGDPSGKKKTRPALSESEVASNARTYVEQAGSILDVSRVEVRFNSEWMDQLSSADFIRLASQYPVARMLEREDFKQRYRSGTSISIHEFLYPLVQGYDSVALEADIEVGGTDQLFNLLLGRELQRSYGQDLWEGVQSDLKTRGEIVREAVEQTGGLVRGVFSDDDASAEAVVEAA